jgi:alkanesulfonate monooxygenase SsuD/methylene tetrahydromethanopterin reductase-like flavin-dependent oxidoreductase (luciferase family)
MWRSNPQSPVEFNGRAIRIHGYSRFYPPVRERIPIYFGGMNPQMLRATGEVADGWLGGGLTSPQLVKEVIREHIRAGAAKAGRQEGDIEFVCPISCAVSPDREQARAWARSHIAFYANVTYYDIVMALHGFQKETRAIREAFARGDRTAATQAVTDAMIDAFVLAGTEDECRGRVKAWSGCADVLSFRHTYFDPTIPREALPGAYQSLFRLAQLL